MCIHAGTDHSIHVRSEEACPCTLLCHVGSNSIKLSGLQQVPSPEEPPCHPSSGCFYFYFLIFRQIGDPAETRMILHTAWGVSFKFHPSGCWAGEQLAGKEGRIQALPQILLTWLLRPPAACSPTDFRQASWSEWAHEPT